MMQFHQISLPDPCLVVLIGASGSGKSTFARTHFRPTEIVSSDLCRGLVSDDETNQDATGDAFDLLTFLAGKRLARLRLTVIDATSVYPVDRARLVTLARGYHLSPVAIVLNLPEHISHSRNALRPDRCFGPHVVQNQRAALEASLSSLGKEGFKQVYILNSEEEIALARITRRRLPPDRRLDHGPFDIIGDVHGCFEELKRLLERLGYTIQMEARPDGSSRYHVRPPEGRQVLFLGDLVDRGPGVVDCLQLAMDMVQDGVALCLLGNHEVKLERWLSGKNPRPTHGLDVSMAQLSDTSLGLRSRVRRFIQDLPHHLVLDDGKLVVAHAGLLEAFAGRTSGQVRSFALYGQTTGEFDARGLPVRIDWAADYAGRARVVYGHTPVLEPRWINNTLCLDSGCVFGGSLSALRYPELELVSVPALRTYCYDSTVEAGS